MQVCIPLPDIPYYHKWYTDEPTGPAPFPWNFSMIQQCPEHDGLPLHNGPDDRYAQEDD